MAYHVENIERITEQMIEEEVLKETEQIRIDSNKKVELIKDAGISDINKIKDSAVAEINEIKNVGVDYIDSEKTKLETSLGTNGNIGQLNAIDAEADKYYKLTLPIASDTTDEIENDIRKMIVDNGYKFSMVNDGHGNVDVVLVKEV